MQTSNFIFFHKIFIFSLYFQIIENAVIYKYRSDMGSRPKITVY